MNQDLSKRLCFNFYFKEVIIIAQKNYTIGEKLKYYNKKINKRLYVSENQKEFFNRRIKQLESLQNRYSIINIDDKRMFDYDTGSTNHDYIVANSKKGFVKVVPITDSKKIKGIKLDNFNGNSKFSKRVYGVDKSLRPIHYHTCYTTYTKNAILSNDDIIRFDKQIKK